MEYLTLEELQNEELKIAIEIDKYCNEHDIKYFLSSGSLLGAIRHHGFIPWDDDMDMYMARDDYDKFCNTFSHDQLIIKYCENGTLHAPFAKVCNPNILVESEALGDEDNSLLWVDIFPIDGAAKTKDEQNKRFKKVAFWTKLLMANRTPFYPAKNPIKNFIKHLVYYFYKKFLTRNQIIKISKRISNFLRQIPTFSTGFITNTLWPAVYPAEILKEREKYDFNGYKFYSFKMYDLYLSTAYGDYMTLPPEDKRELHHLKAYFK